MADSPSQPIIGLWANESPCTKLFQKHLQFFQVTCPGVFTWCTSSRIALDVVVDVVSESKPTKRGESKLWSFFVPIFVLGQLTHDRTNFILELNKKDIKYPNLFFSDQRNSYFSNRVCSLTIRSTVLPSFNNPQAKNHNVQKINRLKKVLTSKLSSSSSSSSTADTWSAPRQGNQPFLSLLDSWSLAGWMYQPSGFLPANRQWFPIL